jgi:hypothetical protein
MISLSHDWPMGVVFSLLLVKFPLTDTLISLGLVILFYIKKHRFYKRLRDVPQLRPESGDIIVYFTDKRADLLDLIIWKGGLTLPSSIPVSHYSLVLDDEYFLESHHPDNKRYDYLTGGTRAGMRMGLIKNIPQDWSNGPALVIKTNFTFTPHEREKLLKYARGRPYWSDGGCIGAVNNALRVCKPDHPNVISPEGFMKLYGLKIGWINLS